ncbi:uncharacterized protein si:ch211-274k16.2 [Antennarius striatus]|uniref:uncharacterized protein si:ch211-274k16.2 n=1 Tax=Antennarius striatus TaxID=241820 RepID=UPI0035AEDCF0
MLVPVCLSILMTMMMKSDGQGASVETVTAHVGDAVLLSSDLQEVELGVITDIRWTHPHLLISLLSDDRKCHHGRCELLRNGSLRFSRVQTADSGNYKLQVFDASGMRVKVKQYQLEVDDVNNNNNGSNARINAAVVPVSIVFVPVLLLFVILFVVMKRSQRMRTGQVQENMYEVMHNLHGNKRKEEKVEREEESHYVPCHPAVSMATRTTTRMSAGVEANQLLF